MSRAVTLDAVPITAATTAKGEIWIYEGHIKKETISPKVREERGLDPDAVLVVWHATFDTKDPAKAAQDLAKTATELRKIIFR